MKIIKFHQDACQPCRMVENFLDNVINKQPDEIYNVWDNDKATLEAVQKYQILQTPVLLLVDDKGQEVSKVLGFKPPEIEALFDKRG